MGRQLGSAFDLPEVSTPTASPATNRRYLYFKADGNLYTKNSAGSESLVGGAVTSVAGRTGAVVLVKGDVGLGNVDNTSDANKPVSTATQTQLNLKIDTAAKGVLNGVASLDGSVRLPVAQLPVSAATTDTAQTLSGAKTFSAMPLLTLPAGSLDGSQLTSASLRVWHDRLRFTAPTYETSPDGSAWTAGTAAQAGAPLAARADSSTSIPAATYGRWTWSGTAQGHDSWTQIQRLLLKFGYASPAPTIIVNLWTSPDGTTWTQRITNWSVSASANQYVSSFGDPGDHEYLQLQLQNTGTVACVVNGIEFQTPRWGDQGSSPHKEMPYYWDYQRVVGFYNVIRPMTDAAYDLGQAGNRWRDGYFSNSVSIGGQAAVKTNDARLSDARTPTAHNHAAADINSGVLGTARLGTGTPSAANWLRGDGVWQAIAQGDVGGLTTALANKQDVDSDLTAIAAISPANDDLIQRKSGAWVNRTMAQVKTDLGLTKTDVGLGNVANVDTTNAANISTGVFALGRLGTGTPAARTYVDGSTGAWTPIGVPVQTSEPASPAVGQMFFDSDEPGASLGSIAQLDLATDHSTTTPTSPTTGLRLFTRHRARRMLAQIGPSGMDTQLQPAIFSNRIATINTVNSVAVPLYDGLAVTNINAPTAVANASTNFYTAMVRHRYASTATAGTAGGTRSATAQWFTSATNNMGGMFMVCRFGLNAITATNRLFIGFSTTTGALAAGTNPSALLNMFGFAADSTHTTWRFMWNDGTGTASSVDLGANFPCQTAATYFFEFRIFVPSGAGNSVLWSAHRLNDGQVVNGGTTVTNNPTPITTDLPAVGSLLSWHFHHSNGTTATAVSTDLQALYIETDN